MEDKESSCSSFKKQPLSEPPSIPPTDATKEKSSVPPESKKKPAAGNGSTAKQTKSPPKKRGRPPKNKTKGQNDEQPKKPANQIKKTKKNKKNSGSTTTDSKTTSIDEKNDATTTTTTTTAPQKPKRTRVPTKRLLEHLSLTAESSATTTKKKKKRGRPAKKMKDMFTYKDLIPMETASSDGGVCSSGNSSYGDYENGGGEHEDDIICCVCHCAVDYSDSNMFEPLDETVYDADNYAVNKSESSKTVESVNEREKAGEKASNPETISAEEKASKNSDAETDKNEPLLPRSLYDPQNAILLCDTPGCNRAYHQRCHFVPVFVIPRGDWHCLICRYGHFLRSSGRSCGKRRGRPPKQLSLQSNLKTTEENGNHVFQQSDLIRIFRSKPYRTVLREEKEKQEEESKRSQPSLAVEKEDKPMNHISSPQQQQQSLENIKVPFSVIVKKNATMTDSVIMGDSSSKKEVPDSINCTSMVKKAPVSQEGENALCPPNMGNIKNAVDAITADGANTKSALLPVGTTSEKCNKPHQNLEAVKGPFPIEAPIQSQMETLPPSSLLPPVTNQQISLVSSHNINPTHKQQIINNNNISVLLPKPQIPLDKLQKQFECSTSALKSSLLHSELTIRIKSTINQCLSRIRLSQDTLRAYTETDRSRKSLLATYEQTQRLPQEIVQSLSNMAKGKLRIRETLESLDKFIKGYDDVEVLMKWLCGKDEKGENNDHDVKKNTGLAVGEYPSWFSTDVVSHRRTVPRICSNTDSDENSRHNQDDKIENMDKNGTAKKTSQKDGSDDDDMIETDDLACAVCFSGTCSDSNDLLLCDGEGCNRCFHMNCITPRVTQQELGDDDDSWFCPYCSNLAVLVHYAQVEYLGDEWEERLRRKEQYKRHHHHEEDEHNDDNESTSSWERATDVFPEAEYENSVATKWRDGIRDNETDALLSSFLGCSLSKSTPSNNENSISITLLDQDDDEEEDEDYDDDDEKGDDKSSRESGSDDDNTSLADISSIESGIDKSELDALSSCSSSDSEHDDDDDDDEDGRLTENQKTRRSKRNRGRNYSLSKKTTTHSSSIEEKDAPPSDVGALDEANIIVGKRNRTKVDYRRLNDAMFGDVSATEAAILFDDEDDYHYDGGSSKTKRGRRQKNSSDMEEDFNARKKQKKVKPSKKGMTSKKRGRPRKKTKIDETAVGGNVNETDPLSSPKGKTM